MNNIDTVQRSFMIGDSWLYYKVYTGHKTADRILAEVIRPLAQRLLNECMIEKWFFIRYSDPKPHLRIRFCLKDKGAVSSIITLFYDSLSLYVKEELVWKFQIEDYHRELERYGHNTMEEAESLFQYDSQFVVSLLNLIEGEEGEELKWLLALRGIDSLLSAFNYSLEEKLNLTDKMKNSFANEFGMSRFLKKQLDEKYRVFRKKIDQFLNESLQQEQELAPILVLLKQREVGLKAVAKQISLKEKDQVIHISIDDLMSSYIHMFMNRLFRSQNRKYELVIHDFLHRSYNSQHARLRHQKSDQP
ncbi:thiopeptide-type bacteriocin biosynthesis protein [Roseivirga misakiensis]|nr:thiopeptide-type bacteriocin biosynthesis protein [Roseivirga misakiensis]